MRGTEGRKKQSSPLRFVSKRNIQSGLGLPPSFENDAGGNVFRLSLALKNENETCLEGNLMGLSGSYHGFSNATFIATETSSTIWI